MQPPASPRPSAMPDSATTTPRGSDVRRPWVLVDAESRIDCWRNATTARGSASNGTSIEVSFELADPPAVSLFFVHCPDQTSSAMEADPRIVNAAGAFVLLLVFFAPTARRSRFEDYFVYRAGPGRPSLDLIPAPYPHGLYENTVGVLPLCDDGQHYAVVMPLSDSYVRSRKECRFRVFRSDRCRTAPWSTKPVQLAGVPDGDEKRYFDYGLDDGVVYAGAGLLGWINLCHGVLLCNVLDEDPVMRVIHWPVPAPVGTDGRVCEEGSGRTTRHATIADGVIKFTDLEFHQHCRACRRSCSGAVSSGSKGALGEGWTATTWTKTVSSTDRVWQEAYTVDTRHVFASGSSYPRLLEKMSRCHLLPEILDGDTRLAWEDKLMSAVPTLSLGNGGHDDDVMYIMAKRDYGHPWGWVLAINGREKTLVDLAQFNAERMLYFNPTYLPCAFSNYLQVI